MAAAVMLGVSSSFPDCRSVRLVSLRRRDGVAAALPCRRTAAHRCVLSVDSAEASRNALQVETLQKSGDTELSRFERRLEERSAQLLHEVALRTRDGIAIYLVGMMASGKSFVGAEVAKPLKYNFIDSDDVIQSYKGGKPCGELYDSLGETSFRDLETKALQSLSEEKCLVMATGGGAVCKEDNWNYLNGVTVWLDVPLEELVKRVTNVGTDSRPLLRGKCPESELSRLMEERMPHYNKAHCRLSVEALAESLNMKDVGALTPTAIAVQVLEEVKQALQKEKFIPPPTGH